MFHECKVVVDTNNANQIPEFQRLRCFLYQIQHGGNISDIFRKETKLINLNLVMRKLLLVILWACFELCQAQQNPFVLVLGVAQDGGYPHPGCKLECCRLAWKQDSVKWNVVSLAIVDQQQKRWWLLEATPDITQQLQLFNELTEGHFNYLPDGILLTHAHIGHYTGLMYLGREAMGAKSVPVYVLPKFAAFINTNGPWSQLVKLKNIDLKIIEPDKSVKVSDMISITAFTVPHRDEFSETAGFKIETSSKKYLFIPDIDKWEKWSKKITNEVDKVDVAFLDATFYQAAELPGRDIREVPHPFVIETMKLFSVFPQKNKIQFIHFNHTNPLMWNEAAQKEFLKSGFGLAKQGKKY